MHDITEIGRVEIGRMKKKKGNVQVAYKVIPDGAPSTAPAAEAAPASNKAKQSKGGDKGAAKAPKGGKVEGGKKAAPSGPVNIKDADSIEAALGQAQFLGGQNPSSVDRDAFNHIVANVGQVSADSHPYTFAWFFLLTHF